MRKNRKNRCKISLWFRLLGYVLFSFEAKEYVGVLNLVLQSSLPVISVCEGMIAVPCRSATAWALALQEKKIAYTSYKGGLPFRVARYRLRAGLFLGALIFVLTLFLGTQVAWEVRIEGNEELLSADIKTELSEMGVSVGGVIPFMDFEEICNRYRLQNPQIAWMGIYRTGTVLNVKILETDSFKKEEKPKYANVVAGEDAVISEISVTHGTPVVKKGQSVKKGDLLVSGILKGDKAEAFICAEAVVIGERTEEISVFVPYLQTQSVDEETVLERYIINFFGKSINISINSGEIPESYGTIIKEEAISFSDGRRLPLSLARVLRVKTVEQCSLLSHEEALRLAYTLLKNKLSSLLKGGMLLSKSITATATESGVCLHGIVRYTVNVAELLPFSVTE